MATRYSQAYVYGSAAPAPQRRQAPPSRKERERAHQEQIRRREEKIAVARNREAVTAMNPGYVAFLTVAFAILAAFCMMFISLQSDITTRIDHIAKLNTELAEMKEQNTALQKTVDTAVSLEDIKKAALEAGMTYPTEDQVIYYSIDSNDYMNQYGSVTE